MIEGVPLFFYPKAFAAGLVSFASPCVLGLVPGYLSFVSGVSHDELGARTRNIIWPIVAFVAGFSAVFALMGASAGLIGRNLLQDRHLLNQVGGGLLILAGIAFVVLPRLGWFQSDRRIHLTRRPTTLMGSALVGCAFAAGWSPCIGPFLGVISLEATSGTPATGALLLFIYGLGLGIPFILSGLFLTRSLRVFGWLRARWTVVTGIAAVLTIGVGILMATQQLTAISRELANLGFQGI